MSVRDFFLAMLVCLLWASNSIVTKYALADLGLPPLFFGALRFTLVALVALAWLLPAPKDLVKVIPVAILMGAGNFGLAFVGMKYAPVASVAVVSQVSVPAAAILSMMILKERISPWRAAGIVMTLAGALLIIWHGGPLDFDPSLFFVAAGATMGALSSVLVKRLNPIKPLQFQAWVSLSSILPLLLLSVLLEPHPWSVPAWTQWQSWVCLVYGSLVVTFIGHTIYFGLLQRHDATVVVPLTLMMPVFSIAMGAVIFGEELHLRLFLGAFVTLLGVLVIVLRRNQVAAMLLALRNRLSRA